MAIGQVLAPLVSRATAESLVEGDRVEVSGRCGIVLYGPDFDGEYKIRFDDGTASGFLKAAAIKKLPAPKDSTVSAPTLMKTDEATGNSSSDACAIVTPPNPLKKRQSDAPCPDAAAPKKKIVVTQTPPKALSASQDSSKATDDVSPEKFATQKRKRDVPVVEDSPAATKLAVTQKAMPPKVAVAAPKTSPQLLPTSSPKLSPKVAAKVEPPKEIEAQGRRCKKGHPLRQQRAKLNDEYLCDACKRDISLGHNIFDCRKCDYSVCEDCYKGPATPRTSSDGSNKDAETNAQPNSGQPIDSLDPSAVLKTTQRVLTALPFIQQRCLAVHGKTVQDVRGFTLATGAAYCRADFRYDINTGYLEVLEPGSEAGEAPEIVPVCRKGHPLLEKVAENEEDEYQCDTCQGDIHLGHRFLDCDKCDFSMCVDCNKAREVAALSSAPKEKKTARGSTLSPAQISLANQRALARLRCFGKAMSPSTCKFFGGALGIQPLQWIQSLKKSHKLKAPQLRPKVQLKQAGARLERLNAVLLRVLCGRYCLVGLSAPLLAALRAFAWGPALLEAWESEKVAREQREAKDPEARVEDDDCEPAGEDADVKKEPKHMSHHANHRAKQAAVLHLLERIGQRWPDRRPASHMKKKRKPNGCLSSEEEVEHRDAHTLAGLRGDFMAGTLDERARSAILQLPESWALTLVFNWEVQFLMKLNYCAERHKAKMPDPIQASAASEQPSVGRPRAGKEDDEELKGSAKLLHELRTSAISSVEGLHAHAAQELAAWFPWGGSALEQWATERTQRKDSSGLHGDAKGTTAHRTLEKLKQVIAEYPTQPPTKRLYCSSDQELAEQSGANAVVSAARVYYHGGLSNPDAAAVMDACPWGKALLEQWKASKADNLDPDDAERLQRLRQIAERYPTAPVTNPSRTGFKTEKELWGLPAEVRLQRADACWFRNLKERFNDRGLTEPVLEAIRAIPVWGAERLQEWELEKEQCAQQLWEKNQRRKSGAEDGEKDGAPVQVRTVHLRQSDVLRRTSKKPWTHKSRMRIAGCHGKTVKEALRRVLNGRIPLTLGQIRSDVRLRILEVETSQPEEDGEKNDNGGEGGEQSPASPTASATVAPLSVEKISKRKSGQRGVEAFRGFDGSVLRVEPEKKVARRDLRPLDDLNPGDVDTFSSEDLLHYERQLDLSTKRALSERQAQLAVQHQSNKLSFALAAQHTKEAEGSSNTKSGGLIGADGSSAAGAGAAERVQAKDFHDLTPYERSQLSAGELAYYERSALVLDGGELSLAERRDRMRDHIHKLRAQAATKESAAAISFFRGWSERSAKEKASAGVNAGATSELAPQGAAAAEAAIESAPIAAVAEDDAVVVADAKPSASETTVKGKPKAKAAPKIKAARDVKEAAKAKAPVEATASTSPSPAPAAGKAKALVEATASTSPSPPPAKESTAQVAAKESLTAKSFFRSWSERGKKDAQSRAQAPGTKASTSEAPSQPPSAPPVEEAPAAEEAEKQPSSISQDCGYDLD